MVVKESIEEATPLVQDRVKKLHFEGLLIKIEPWLFLFAVAIFLGIWEWQAQAGNISQLFFPAPSKIAITFVDLMLHGGLAFDLSVTVTRTLKGFAIGGGIGFLLGISMGWFAHLRRSIDPLIAILHPVPKITFLPVVLIILGIGENAKLALIAFAAFFPMAINTMAAVLEINPVFFEVAKNYGAGPLALFRRVVLPGSLAGILTGTRLSLVRALGTTLVIEIRFAKEGLGEIIWTSWEILRTANLFAVVILIAVLGYTINASLLWLRGYLAPWHQSSRLRT